MERPSTQGVADLFATTPESREISWAATHEALWPIVVRALRHGPLPIIGTHDWLDLAAGDPRRVGAVYLAAEQWTLHLEARGLALTETSREIADALPWGAVGRSAAERRAWLEANPWAKRVSA